MTKEMREPRVLVLAGDVKDVCKYIASEAAKYKGMTVANYLNFKNLQQIVNKQIEEIIDALKQEKRKQRRLKKMVKAEHYEAMITAFGEKVESLEMALFMKNMELERLKEQLAAKEEPAGGECEKKED
jgi:heme oxygenase